MNLRFKFLTAGIIGLLFVGCAGESNTDAENQQAENVETQAESKKCVYSFNHEHTEISFTAFKFLNKTGVGGAFKEFTISGGETQENPLDVIKNLSFEIPVASLFTQDASRDGKIGKFFFDTLGIDVISGKVIDLNNENASLEITMNGITNNVEGTYTLNDNNFDFEAEINVEDWDCAEGITALNNECHDLHIDYANGDKESKLWSDVVISFQTTLDKNCD